MNRKTSIQWVPSKGLRGRSSQCYTDSTRTISVVRSAFCLSNWPHIAWGHFFD